MLNARQRALIHQALDAEPVAMPGLGPALKAARVLGGYRTTKALAAVAGLRESHLVAFERGTKVPTRAQLRAIWNAVTADAPTPNGTTP